MANKLHIKKGDNVRVLSGVYRGQEGQILKIYPKTQRAIVEGINLISKHVRPSQQNPDGGIIEQEGTIHISNLMVIDPSSKRPSRIGRKKIDGQKGWVRYAKKSGEIIK